ncbi:HAMP domain-containing sensor histidine kinase [Arthrobacter sp. APC 3897]|uniref:sensor histidine kinase n=1 Tax=Arthrobacter sp. APC 3897 TaxID=3035204 RepID=UPI0025B42C6C|nr:HAMP domain-containing sensor histidine kinase [Arthrobacter sp. APC 3897]MDN3481209.1 HAMP domain-containing sensor histidine kinase [Arthrobacter sp. APC 3897]
MRIRRRLSGKPRSLEEAELRRAALRLAVQFTALTVVLLGLAAVLVYGLVSTQTRSAAEQTLLSAVDSKSPRDVPLDVFLAVYDDGRLAVSRNMPSGLPDEEALADVAASGESRRDLVTAGDRSYEVLTVRRGGDVVQAAVDTGDAAEQLRRLALALVVSVLAAGIAAGALSAWAARAAMRPMAEALALQRRFVADASHELRTPLTLLSMRAQMLRRRLSAEAVEPRFRDAAVHAADEVVEDTKVLNGILEDLLMSADPRHTGPLEEINLVELAGSAVNSLQPAAHRRGLVLELDAPDPQVPVRGGQFALQRVFTALGDNALEYARSRVRFSVRKSGREAVIRVSDDGPGFPPGFSRQAFERFASARDRTDETSGPRHYGLGLALVAEIAARYGGSVQALPAVNGSGGVLEVRLPAAREHSPA